MNRPIIGITMGDPAGNLEMLVKIADVLEVDVKDLLHSTSLIK